MSNEVSLEVVMREVFGNIKVDPKEIRPFVRHPLGALLPDLDQVEFDALKQSIATHGQQRPIEVYEDKILDGWHRLKVCEQLEVEPRFVQYSGDPVSLIAGDMNRRHLAPGQRAMIVAQAVELVDKVTAEASARMNAGTRPSGNVALGSAGQSRDALAKVARVSPRTMQAALTVQHRGTAAERAAVSSGQASPSRAAKAINTRTLPASVGVRAFNEIPMRGRKRETAFKPGPSSGPTKPQTDTQRQDQEQLRVLWRAWKDASAKVRQRFISELMHSDSAAVRRLLGSAVDVEDAQVVETVVRH